MAQLNTKEKCTLRDLIKIEIKSLTRDGYGEYRYVENEYCAFLLKLGRKLKLDTQQKIKELYAERKNIYKMANHKITCDNLSKENIAIKIIALHEKYKNYR